MRVYFHLVRGQEVIRDETGVEVADLDEARSEAVDALRELLREDPSFGADWTGWRLDVADAAGTVIFSIDLDTIAP